MIEHAKVARIFKVFSVEARVRIVQLLKSRPLCVGALSARLGLTQGAVSQHLRVLRDTGVVIPEKRGYYVHYRLNAKTLARWKDATGRLLALKPNAGSLVNPRRTAKKGAKACAERTRDARNRRN